MLQKLLESSRKNAGAVIILVSAAILSKLFGFIRNAVLAYLFGTTSVADEYNLLTYPTELILSFVVNNTIITALVSMFGNVDDSKTTSLFWKILHFYQMVLTGVTVGIILTMEILYSQLSLPLLMLSGFAAILYGMSGVIQSYLYYRQKFYRASLQDLFSQIILTVGIGISSMLGLQWFGLALIVSGLIRISLLIPDLKQLIGDISFRQFIPMKIESRKELFIGVLPLLLSFFMSNIPGFLLIFLFEREGIGFISAYNYALKVTAVFNPIFIIPLTTYAIPKLQQLEKKKQYTDSYLYGTLILLLATAGGIVFSFFVWLFAGTITQVLYARGSFDTNAITMTSEMLRWYVLPVPCYAAMYFLLQRIVLSGRNNLVLVAYIAGTIVTIVGFVFPLPILQKGAVSLAIGTLVSILILFYGLFSTKKELS
ncbi:MAG: lipid II flippase MurJ [Candidatus Dojkabacteria bacterium]|nr:MAG: lipid II flippase MurJ [Candidatus Dojkabacteria bacterium]